MAVLTATSFFQANLAALGRRNAAFAEQLAAIEPSPELLLLQSDDGVAAGVLNGRLLCSRVHPLAEAARLVDDIDLVEHAAVVVLGFGVGWHVRRLAERSDKSTLIIVYEPDVSLLRAVFEQVDHSAWMREALLLFVTDEQDRGALAGTLAGAEAILGQGVHILEHPASRARLGERAGRFAQAFRELVEAAKTTLATTLMRSVDTVRNLLLNLDHYAMGSGIADLAGVASGCPAVIVAAGPSLHRNMRLLGDEGVRDRCIIIAVQTALRPLLEAGIKPHFVTALDYHEISRRFYESLAAEDLRDVTLIADPKVNPVVLDVYPGPVRCCGNGFLDSVLGPMARPMGDVPAGATVAHLAMYFARHLGCDPVAMIGQDLGFPDGLYYAPGAAIHDTWAAELNPFNTIAMMEWQRIARHRVHLRRTQDVNHRAIFTDAQMHTYLQQFERDFAEYARRGLTTVDATEGGVLKQHTKVMPLREFLHAHANGVLPTLPSCHHAADNTARLLTISSRLSQLAAEVLGLRDLSRATQTTLERMLADQRDASRMARHFERIEANRREVESRMDAFELLNHMDQMGVFRRMKADRRLQMAQGLDAMTVQRRQLERDLANVKWLAGAADEMHTQLVSASCLVKGQRIPERPSGSGGAFAAPSSRVAALIPVDPRKSGLGLPRSLDVECNGRNVLQVTLERLGQSRMLESIILIAPRGFDVESLVDHRRIGVSVEVERCEGESPFGPEHEAIAVARLFACACWRGGIAGMSACDEVLCPQVMHEIMSRRGLTAALLCGPDWPLVNVTDEGGCDAVVRRHNGHPAQHNLVFTQSPPGICGCVVSASLMRELSQRNRLATIGGLLVYQPHAPQHDPIAREACVQTSHATRTALCRAVFDARRWRAVMDVPASSLDSIVGDIDRAYADSPQHLVMECTTTRTSRGIFARSLGAAVSPRPPVDLAIAERMFGQMAQANIDDLVLSLHGAGDPLLHPRFDDIIRAAKQAGIRAIHMRTELLCDHATIDRLLESGVDVVSVDLNADRAVTYQAMMGCDRFRDVLTNLEYLIEHRRRLTRQSGSTAIALPWVVPHLQRRAETYEDIDTFFDRWQHMLGAAVIEDPPPSDPRPIGLTPATTPERVLRRNSLQRMTILCDGGVPVSDLDFTGHACTCNAFADGMVESWRVLQCRRR